MYKTTTYLFLILILSVFQLRAQSLASQLTQAKLNIIRASVNFLATDTIKFKNIKKPIFSTGKDYPELISFADSNKLKGVKALVIKWRGIKLDTNSVDEGTKSLNGFKEKVISDISTGNNTYRKQSPFSFEEFKSSVMANVLKADATVAGQDEAIVQTDNQSASTPTGSEPSFINITNIAYLEALIILCLLVYLMVALKKKKSKSKELAFLKKERDTIVREQTQLEDRFKDLTAKNNELEEKLNVIMLKEETPLKESVAEEPVNINTVEWHIDKQEITKLPERFYTKYADLIDGFSVAELVEVENNETIFEIRLKSPNKATFKVSENPAAQKYALTNADYFLQKTCMYDVVPFGKITTEKEGQLSLSGGKWEIIEPAKISFK